MPEKYIYEYFYCNFFAFTTLKFINARENGIFLRRQNRHTGILDQQQER